MFKALSWSRTHLSTVATLTALSFEVDEAEELMSSSNSSAWTLSAFTARQLHMNMLEYARGVHAWSYYYVIIIGAVHACSICHNVRPKAQWVTQSLILSGNCPMTDCYCEHCNLMQDQIANIMNVFITCTYCEHCSLCSLSL